MVFVMVDATTVVPDCIVGIEGINTAPFKGKLHQSLAIGIVFYLKRA